MRQFAMVMSLLFLLVMVYVWQHFSAIEIGYQIEAQKQQVEQLREENRQLRLTEAQLTDPERIDKIAKQLGLDEPQPGQVVRPDGGDRCCGAGRRRRPPRCRLLSSHQRI